MNSTARLLRIVVASTAFTASVGALFVFPAQASGPATVQSLAGDRTVFIFTGEKVRAARPGDELEFWDVIQTSRHAAAKIRYADGTEIVIGRDTKFELQPKQDGVQYNQLAWGQVRAQVEKSKKVQTKPKFIIRTKTAVMGVRGTDFVAGFDPAAARSSLHTFDGTVSMSSDESQVLAGGGTSVGAGQQADLGEGAGAPTLSKFIPLVYEQETSIKQPELIALAEVRNGAQSTSADPTVETTQNVPPSPKSPVHSSSSDEAILSLLSFRVGAISIFQNSTVHFTTALAAWVPSLTLLGPLAIRGFAGGFGIKNGDTGKNFPAFKLGALLDVRFIGQLHLEAGAGLDTWLTDTMGKLTALSLIGNVVFHFQGSHWIESLYVGGAPLLTPDSFSSSPVEWMAGVGAKF